MIAMTRRLEFDYGHRLLNHESKCAHVHGHRGVVEITCKAQQGLDHVGRVVDFGEVKKLVGGWIDTCLDHAFIADPRDTAAIEWLRADGQRLFIMPDHHPQPSAENLALVLLGVAQSFMAGLGIDVVSVTFHETPNGSATAVAE
jgi:6-pyruvoyltetrahydropterin/6-carboxytetrahydropterin synthase